MAEIYEGMGDVYGIKVAPIGRRWWKYQNEHPEINLYAQDGEHASMDGSVLVAQVIYETLFLEGQWASAPEETGHKQSFFALK